MIHIVGTGAVGRYFATAIGAECWHSHKLVDWDSEPLAEWFVPAVGDNRKRKEIVARWSESGGRLPGAVVEEPMQRWLARTPGPKRDWFVRLAGDGTLVLSSATAREGSTVGWCCLVHAGVVIDHDCVVEDYVNIAPGAVLCGNVRVGEGATVGAGAVVCERCVIGDWAIVGAGCVLPPDTTVGPGETWVGVPGRKV